MGREPGSGRGLGPRKNPWHPYNGSQGFEFPDLAHPPSEGGHRVSCSRRWARPHRKRLPPWRRKKLRRRKRLRSSKRTGGSCGPSDDSEGHAGGAYGTWEQPKRRNRRQQPHRKPARRPHRKRAQQPHRKPARPAHRKRAQQRRKRCKPRGRPSSPSGGCAGERAGPDGTSRTRGRHRSRNPQRPQPARRRSTRSCYIHRDQTDRPEHCYQQTPKRRRAEPARQNAISWEGSFSILPVTPG